MECIRYHFSNLHQPQYSESRFRMQLGSVQIPLLKFRSVNQISSRIIPLFSVRKRNCKLMDDIRAGCSSGGEPKSDGGGASIGLLVASTVTISLATANRVLYKLALVPMKEYPFFMAQTTTFG